MTWATVAWLIGCVLFMWPVMRFILDTDLAYADMIDIFMSIFLAGIITIFWPFVLTVGVILGVIVTLSRFIWTRKLDWPWR